MPPLWRVFGGHGRSAGHWALPELAADVASSDAALHLGPQFIVLETAALEQAAAVAGTDQLQGVLSHVMFVARGKRGPFRIEAEPIDGADRMVAVRTLMHDEGADDRVITVGSYLFRTVER